MSNYTFDSEYTFGNKFVDGNVKNAVIKIINHEVKETNNQYYVSYEMKIEYTDDLASQNQLDKTFWQRYSLQTEHKFFISFLAKVCGFSYTDEYGKIKTKTYDLKDLIDKRFIADIEMKKGRNDNLFPNLKNMKECNFNDEIKF